MAYCTQDDIIALELTEKELIQLTDDDDLGEIDSAMVSAAIAKADAEIDAYCQNSYSVPFTSVPTIVKGWSATLAAFNLYRNNTKPATLIDRYNKAMSWLKDISQARTQIPGTDQDALSLPESTTRGYEPVFKKQQADSGGSVQETGTMEVW